jgi:hypothetical protein
MVHADALRVPAPWRASLVTKDDLDLHDDDDWLNAEVGSDVTPRLLQEFRAWMRKDEPSDQVAAAVERGWLAPPVTIN